MAERKRMKANFEVIAYKNGKRTIRYYVLEITTETTTALYDKFEQLGYTDISIRMI